MNPSKHTIETLLTEIHGEIAGLKVDEDFKELLLEDSELSILCFAEKNILSVLNCLTALVDTLHTHLILASSPDPVIKKLLFSIHHLQQMLIRLPVCIVGPTGAMGATGPAGTCGPVGPIGPTGATGPAGTSKTTTVITSCYPVSGYPIPKQTFPTSSTSHKGTGYNSYRKS